MTTGSPSHRQDLEKASQICPPAGLSDTAPPCLAFDKTKCLLSLKKTQPTTPETVKNKRISRFHCSSFWAEKGKWGVGEKISFVCSQFLFHTGNVPEARSELWVNSMCTHSGQLTANHLADSLFPDNKPPWLLSLISNWNKHPLHFWTQSSLATLSRKFTSPRNKNYSPTR